MRPNTLETDKALLYRLGRAQSYVQVGTAIATVTSTTFLVSGYGTDYPQQLQQLSWAYAGSGVTAATITITALHGATEIGSAEIPIGTADGDVGGVLSVPVADLDLTTTPIEVVIEGAAGNVAGSTVGVTALLRPL